MYLTSDFHCPRASVKTGSGAKLPEESSECVRETLVVVKVELSRLLSAEWGHDGAAASGFLSWEVNPLTPLLVHKFILESNLNPISFCPDFKKDGEQRASILNALLKDPSVSARPWPNTSPFLRVVFLRSLLLAE